jgi:hypothetical protein
MKARLSYDYDPMAPEEVSYINNLQVAQDLKGILCDYDQWLRGIIKYNDLPEEQDKIYQECRDKLYEFLNENGINLYEV